jgi:hypothetical protein
MLNIMVTDQLKAYLGKRNETAITLDMPMRQVC